MNEVSPCKGCANRQPACHDQCEKYKEWRDRYHAQQKHFKDNRYRMLTPMTAAREEAYRTHRQYRKGGWQ